MTVEGNDLVATWNLVDVRWIEFFGKSGMKKTYKMIIKLDENTHQISYNEQTGEVTWQAGVPKVSFAVQNFSGKTISWQTGAAWGIKENGQLGQIYSFDFNTDRIKNPILNVIVQAGWVIKKSWLEKLLGF